MGYILKSDSDSGLYTPILDSPTDCVTAVQLQGAIYTRNGNVVNVTIGGLIDIDTTLGNNGTFNFTLPFTTSSVEIYGGLFFGIDHNINGCIIGTPSVSIKTNNIIIGESFKFTLNCTYFIQ
jgi:hypothetical protein